jgi:hypothetical protein
MAETLGTFLRGSLLSQQMISSLQRSSATVLNWIHPNEFLVFALASQLRQQGRNLPTLLAVRQIWVRLTWSRGGKWLRSRCFSTLLLIHSMESRTPWCSQRENHTPARALKDQQISLFINPIFYLCRLLTFVCEQKKLWYSIILVFMIWAFFHISLWNEIKKQKLFCKKLLIHYVRNKTNIFLNKYKS